MDREAVISLNDYLTASDKYPERALNVAPELIANAERLLSVVNEFLAELGVENCRVSSGYRPAAVNAKIPNAAKKSLHMTCLAIDIQDLNGELDKLVQAGPELLIKYSLWLEHPDNTVGWCHLDLGIRLDRPVRVFRP